MAFWLNNKPEKKCGVKTSSQVNVTIVPAPQKDTPGMKAKDAEGTITIPKKKKKVVKQCDKWYGGIGVYMGWPDTISKVMPGYPADKAGLRAGDMIEPVYENDIKGEPGTVVMIRVTRMGKSYIITITRGKICTE